MSLPAKCALICAHPGHELLLHAWLERMRPVVFTLTDGSGEGVSRLDGSAHLIERTGARMGKLFGTLTDHRLYRAILDGEVNRILDLAHELAAELIAARIERVVTDAREGYNSAHDLCSALAGAAVRLARCQGQHIDLYHCVLVGDPATRGTDAIRLDLSETEFARKLKAAVHYGALREEVRLALERRAEASFRTEWLHPASEALWESHGERPFYEVHGERQVAAGRYAEVIRYQAHVRPLVQALARAA